MPSYSWLRLEEFLAINRTEIDQFKKKIEKWDKVSEQVSSDVRAIWERGKNSLKDKMDDFEFEYHSLMGYKNREDIPQAEFDQARRRVRRDLAAVRGAYFSATATLRRADRKGREKEEKAKKEQGKKDHGRSWGISI